MPPGLLTMRPIRLALMGQPWWSGRLAGMLNQHPELQARALAGRAILSPRGLAWLARADLLLRVGFRPGAPTRNGRAFDALWAALRFLNPGAPVVYYWLGTDVLNSLEDARAGRLRQGPHRKALRAVHWADAPWLVEELREVGYQASFHPIPVPLAGLEAPESLPGRFSVLTYVPDARADYYGGREILAAARAMPTVPFVVLGGLGAWAEPVPPNLSFVGWQEDVRPFLCACSVLVRLVAHDGLGGTVREALEAGRHVIYSQAMPQVVHVPFGDPQALVRALAGLEQRHRAGDLRPNLEGRRYVQEAYDFQQSLETYRLLCRSALGLGPKGVAP